jgi:hypothetical protein
VLFKTDTGANVTLVDRILYDHGLRMGYIRRDRLLSLRPPRTQRSVLFSAQAQHLRRSGVRGPARFCLPFDRLGLSARSLKRGAGPPTSLLLPAAVQPLYLIRTASVNNWLVGGPAPARPSERAQ